MIPTDHPFNQRIRALIPINGLEPWLQEQIFSQGELVEFKKRAIVFKEGDDDPHSLFLLDGNLELRAGDDTPLLLEAGDGDALRALAQLRPRRYTARCASAATLFRIKRSLLEHILSDEQVSKDSATFEAAEAEPDEDDDWMSRLLNSALLMRLPPNHIQQFFAELEPVAIDADSNVVEQGGTGDFLYIVAEGKFCVVRTLPGGLREQQLAVLHPGAVFGEEALISELPRNATVRAITEGLVMRLAKSSFEELITRETLRPVPYAEACALVDNGAVWLDARFPEETDKAVLPDAINIPLNQLRLRAKELDRDITYIAYCDTGGRGSTAAYLLARERYDMYFLAGGLAHSPFADAMSSSADDIEPPAELSLEDSKGRMQADFELTSAEPEPESAPESPAVAEPVAEDSPVASAVSAQPASDPISTDGVTKRQPPTTSQPNAKAPSDVSGAEIEAALVNAELSTAVDQLAQERQRAEKALGKWREQMRALKTERDAIAVRAEKAVTVARELKARYEDAGRALNAEQARAQTDREQAQAAQGEVERTLEMERTRLGSEVDALTARLKGLGEDGEKDRAQHEQDRAALQRSIDEIRQELAQSRADTAELDDSARQARDAAQAQIEALREECDSALAKVIVLDAENQSARARLGVLEARFEASRRTIQAQESQIAEAVESASQDVELAVTHVKLQGDRMALDAGCAALAEERATFDQLRSDRDTQFGMRQSELEDRNAALVEKERVYEARREVFEAEFQTERERQQAQFGEQRDKLEREHGELAEEKAAWDDRVRSAVDEERQRLNAAREALDVEMTNLRESRKTAEIDLVQRATELDGRQETLVARLSEVDVAAEAVDASRQAAAGELLAREEALARREAAAQEAAAKLAELAAIDSRATEDLVWARKHIAEQAALFAERQRQLESEIVRLREAVSARTAAAESSSPAQKGTATSAAGATPADAVLGADNFDLDVLDVDEQVTEPQAASGEVKAPDTELDSASESTGAVARFDADLDLLMFDDETGDAQPVGGPSADGKMTAPMDGPPDAADTLPDLEIPADLDRASETDPARPWSSEVESARQRLVSPDQLAAIRARMKEKMAAARDSSG